MKLHALALISIALLSAFSAHAVEIPITSLPVTITKPGNYYFVANMYYAVTVEPAPLTPVAITVNAPGSVTIDLRGFSLSGPAVQYVNGEPTNSTATGISIQSSNVTIKNGSIAGFYNSILATNPNPGPFLTEIDLEKLVFSGADDYSVNFNAVNNSVIRHCDFRYGRVMTTAEAGGVSRSRRGQPLTYDFGMLTEKRVTTSSD